MQPPVVQADSLQIAGYQPARLKYNDARRRSTQARNLRKLPRPTGKSSQRTRRRRPPARTLARAVREGHDLERNVPQAARRSGNTRRNAHQERWQGAARTVPPRQRMTLRDYLIEQQQLVDRELDRLAPPESVAPATIHRAMRYSLFAGGKRIRPLLCLAAAAAVSDSIDGAVTAACTLEFVHTYSLIHDDLPALDNDDYRRGKLTCHKVFGDAIAILDDDALRTLAFQVLTVCLKVSD